PANLDRIHFDAFSQTEVLLRGHAAEIRAPEHFTHLQRIPCEQRNSGADAVTIALNALQPDVQIIAGAFDRTENSRTQQIAGIRSTARNDHREPAIAEQVA